MKTVTNRVVGIETWTDFFLALSVRCHVALACHADTCFPGPEFNPLLCLGYQTKQKFISGIS